MHHVQCVCEAIVVYVLTIKIMKHVSDIWISKNKLDQGLSSLKFLLSRYLLNNSTKVGAYAFDWEWTDLDAGLNSEDSMMNKDRRCFSDSHENSYRSNVPDFKRFSSSGEEFKLVFDAPHEDIHIGFHTYSIQRYSSGTHSP